MSKIFSEGDTIVYPSHGVGKIVKVENQAVAGHELQVFVISFDQDRMTLRLPVAKAETSGLRKLCSKDEMKLALELLKKPAQNRKGVWARRMQEFEAKINTGSPKAIAEVVRDLHHTQTQPDPSYTEQQMYKSALSRLVREFAAIQDVEEEKVEKKIQQNLDKKD